MIYLVSLNEYAHVPTEVTVAVNDRPPSQHCYPPNCGDALLTKAKTLLDLRSHMDSYPWTEIYEGINQHFCKKPYNYQQVLLQGQHRRHTPTTGLNYVGGDQDGARPEELTAA
ncbi:hypothetical protein Tco_0287035 [Tanacetum coccineum]